MLNCFMFSYTVWKCFELWQLLFFFNAQVWMRGLIRREKSAAIKQANCFICMQESDSNGCVVHQSPQYHIMGDAAAKWKFVWEPLSVVVSGSVPFLILKILFRIGQSFALELCFSLWAKHSRHYLSFLHRTLLILLLINWLKLLIP